MNVFPCFTIFAGAFDARPSQPPGRASHAPAKMVQPGKPFTRRVNLKVDKLYYGISIGGINSYWKVSFSRSTSSSWSLYAFFKFRENELIATTLFQIPRWKKGLRGGRRGDWAPRGALSRGKSCAHSSRSASNRIAKIDSPRGIQRNKSANFGTNCAFHREKHEKHYCAMYAWLYFWPSAET